MIQAIKLEGTSMYPLFKAGEIALVETPAAGCRAGDCVVYDLEGRRLLHRVVAADAAGALVRDDAGRLAPHRVPWAAVSGRVVSRNPLKKGLAGLVYSAARKFIRFRP